MNTDQSFAHYDPAPAAAPAHEPVSARPEPRGDDDRDVVAVRLMRKAVKDNYSAAPIDVTATAGRPFLDRLFGRGRTT